MSKFTYSSSSSKHNAEADTFNHGMISPPLIIQLKKLLENYSDGLQILKELVQNGEDAGATEVSFMLDLNKYPEDSQTLIHPALAQFQGYALYSTNDAVFSEDDWTGVRTLWQSVRHTDPFRIGRHGNAFKSVFHLTDLPCMLSGDRLAIIDPLQKAFEASSYSINLSRNPALQSSLRDQLEPYMGVAGCDKSIFRNGFYKGTIFRLPLRNKPSQLSSALCSKEKVYKLFEAFDKEAHLMLIFLTNITKLSLLQKDRSSHAPKTLFKAELAPSCVDEVKRRRLEFRQQIQRNAGREKQLTTSFELTILTEKYLPSSTSAIRKSYSYLVTHHYNNSEVTTTTNLLPCVATAMILNPSDNNNNYHNNTNNPTNYHNTPNNYPINTNHTNNNDSNSYHGNEQDELNLKTAYKLGDDDGRLFAYLPLPLENHPFTGFPILIHGAFLLEQSLKRMNWCLESSSSSLTTSSSFPSSSSSSSSSSLFPSPSSSFPSSPSSPSKQSDEKAIRWNHMLLKLLLPVCYNSMVNEAATLSSLEPERVSVRTVYRAFPDAHRLHKSFHATCQSTFLLLSQSPIFYCPLTRHWTFLKGCVFNSADVTDDVIRSVDDVMVLGKVKVAVCPDHVMVMLKKWVKHLMNFVTPGLVAEVFREVQHNSSFRWESKMKLLRYFLKQPHIEHLHNLHLMPLANGGFDEFQFNSNSGTHNATVYVSPDMDTYSLMAHYQDSMLEWEIEEDLKKILTAVAIQQSTQLRLLDPATVCQLLPSCLPREWLRKSSGSDGLSRGVLGNNGVQNKMQVNDGGVDKGGLINGVVIDGGGVEFPVTWNSQTKGYPPEGWLKALWGFLSRNFPRDLSCVDHLPIIPYQNYDTTVVERGEESVSITTLLIPLRPHQVIIARSMNKLHLDPHLEVTLTNLNIWVINELPDWIGKHPVICKGSEILAPSMLNVLKALELKCEVVGGMPEFLSMFSSRLQADHKRSLRKAFSNLPAFNIPPSSIQLLACLPLFDSLQGGEELLAACDVTIALIQAVSSSTHYLLPFKLSQAIIDCTHSDTASLARLTGLRLLNVPQIVTQVVIPDLHSGYYDSHNHHLIIQFIISNYETFVQVDPNIRKCLKSMPFMPKGDQLFQIDRFYDPTIQLLQHMFLYEENFPPTSFTSPPTISILKKLGLRDEKGVTAEDLKESALLVQQLSTVGNMADHLPGLQQKSCALMTYIQSHKHKLTLKCEGIQLSELLKAIKWVRSMDRPASSSSSSSSSSSITEISYPSSLCWFGGYEVDRANNQVFFSPAQMTLKTHILSSASTIPILESLSPDLIKYLGVNTQPNISLVLQHLNNTIHSYNPNQNHLFSRVVVAVYSIMANFQNQDLLRQLVRESLPKEWVWCGDGFVRPEDLILNADSSLMKKDAPTATTTPRITSPIMFKSRPSTDKNIDLRPYVYVLPEDLIQFKAFFARWGASENLEALRVLGLIRNKYCGGKGFRSAEVDEDVVLCVELLKKLASQVSGVKTEFLNAQLESEKSDPLKQTLSLSRSSSLSSTDQSPDLLYIETFKFEATDHTRHNGHSRPLKIDLSQLHLPTFETDNSASANRIKFEVISKCVYVEGSPLFLARSFANEDLSNISKQGLHLIHPSVPTAVCKLLQIPCFPSKTPSPKPFSYSLINHETTTTPTTSPNNHIPNNKDTLSTKKATKSTEMMSNYADNNVSFTEPIKNLVQPFLKDQLSLPIEMIQNADDAGATEIRFLLDERTHLDAKSSLLDENMQHWQGPSLWIYNDGVMTDDDFAEAFILSSVAKQPNLEKIGRHGRGLCSVYAVTDVPSFVSKNWVVFFDPHMKYLGRSLKEKTKFGLRINLTRFRKQLSSLGDQFKPYEGVFGWSSKNSDSNYPATLFRLPLRSRHLASKSDIHKTPCEPSDVKNLFRSIFENAEHLMLFTQNILKISCYQLSERGSPVNDVCELFTVCKRGIKILRELRPEIHLESSSAVCRSLSKESQKFVKQCSVLKASSLFMKQLLSRGNVSNSQIIDCSTVVSFDVRVFINGEKYLRLKSQQFSKPWLVVGCFGKDEILATATKCHDLLPYSGAAIPLEMCPSNRNHFRPLPLSDHDDQNGGLLFNFLPTYIKTGLPVHINGSFLISEDHQELKSSMKSSEYVGWNDKLLAQVSSSAYMKLISDLANLSPSDPSYSYPFHLAWPDAMLALPEFIPLVKNLYKEICRSYKTGSTSPSIFSDGKNWYSFENIYFFDCGYEDDDLIEASVSIGNKIMKQTNSALILLCLPKQVVCGFQLADMLKLIQSKTYNKVQFFEKVFLPHISSIPEQPRDLLVCEALKNMKYNPGMVTLFKNWQCIPTGKIGAIRLEKPTKLIDPSSKIALLYRGSESSFPSQRYLKDEDVMEGLRILGMRSQRSELTWDEVIERCKQVHNIKDPSNLDATVSILLEVINDKLSNENDQSLSSLRHIQLILHNINFLPAKNKPQDFVLPWCSDFDNNYLYKPSELSPLFFSDIVCCVQPIVNEDLFPGYSENLMTFLKLNWEQKQPMVAQVVDQLDAITTASIQKELSINSLLKSNVQQLCSSCYAYLQDVCKTNNKLQQQSIYELLQNRRFILVDDIFVTCKQLAFSFPYDLKPIFYQLPEHYKSNYSELFRFLDVGEYFAAKDYVEALKCLYDSNKNKPLNRDSLSSANKIVELLQDCITASGMTFDETNKRYGPVYVPAANGTLRSVNRLDTRSKTLSTLKQKVEQRSYPQEQQPQQSSSRNTGNPVFPFQPVNTHPLSRISLPLELGNEENNVINEKNLMISRLRKVMCGRASDRDVLKEILRVADDIGCSEVSIIKDTQQHTLNNNYNDTNSEHNYFKYMQSPSICIHLNKAINQQHINNILQTGHCTKGTQTSSNSTDPSKSGLYGTGFDSVYKISDIPSIISFQENSSFMCLFEPQGKFLQDTSKLQPGRIFEDLESVEQLIPGISSCYLTEKFKPFGSTMIRIPLRNAEIVLSSELSDEPLNEQFIDELFEKLKQEIFDCMLFLKEVSTVTMFENTNNKLLKETYRISVNTDESNVEAKKEFNKSVKIALEDAGQKPMRLIDLPSHEITYPIMISDNMGQWEKWVLSHRFGLDASAEVPFNISENIKKNGLLLTPSGGVAAMLDSSADESHKRCSKVFTRLPLHHKIDMPTHLNGDFCVDKESNKQLWSDSDLGLKNDWNNLLMKYIIAPAYVSILSQIPSMLGNVKSGSGSCVYVGVLDSTGDEVPELDRYTKLFPILNRQTPQGYLKLLIESVYKYIDYKQAAVIPVLKSILNSETAPLTSSVANGSTEVEWYPSRVVGFQKPYFDNLKESYREMEDKTTNVATPSPSTTIITSSFSTPLSTMQGKKRRTRFHMKRNSHEIMRGMLVNCGFKLAKLPISVFESFVSAGVSVSCINPKNVIDFFKSYTTLPSVINLPPLPCEITQTPFRDESSLKLLLEYCSQDIPYFRSNLHQLPLLLCEDGLLKQFSNVRDKRVFLSSAHLVSPGFESLFVHHSLVGSVFKEADVEACDVFWRFDIRALSSHLPSILDRLYQVEAAVSRDIDTKGSPKEVWLKDVWSFLADEYQRTYEQMALNSMQNEFEMVRNLLNPISNWCLLPVLLRQKAVKKSSKSTPVSKRLTSDYVNNNYRDEEVTAFLIPINSSFMTLDYSSDSISGNQIRRHFGRMGIFELDHRFFDDNTTTQASTSAMRGRSPAMFHLKQSTPGTPSQWHQSNNIVSFIRLFVSTPESPEAVLKALDKVLLKPEGPENIGMNLEESFAILSYFNSSMDVWKSNSSILKSLILLPIHLSIDGRLVPIHHDDKTYLLSQSIPEHDIVLLQKKLKLSLLRANPSFEVFYAELKCHVINVDRLYIDYILKNFDLISSDARIHHLTFLKNKLVPSLEAPFKDKFKTSMMRMKVVPDVKETRVLKKPIDIKESDFANISRSNLSSFNPAPPFNNSEWMEFFGKKSTPTHHIPAKVVQEIIPRSEELMTTANKIALSAKKLSSKENTEDNQRKQEALESEAQSLLKHLFHPKVVVKQNFLEHLSSVAFIPAARVPASYLKVHSAYVAPNITSSENEAPTSTTAWVTYKDCVAYKYLDSCWSCCYLLPSWADPLETSKTESPDDFDSRRDIADRLCYNDLPSIESIVEHVQNLCNNTQPYLTKSTTSISEELVDIKQNLKADVFRKIYAHLQERLDEALDPASLNDIHKSLHKLLNVKCIMVESAKFITPRQVAINLYDDDQVPPYLCQAPSDLGQYKRLMLALGVCNIASPEQYALALDNISAQTGGEKLHPNELRLTFNAVRGLFEALRRLRYKDVDPLSKLHWLYLPTVSGYMHRSCSMFFNDDQPSSTILRLQRCKDKKVAGRPFLVHLSECRLSSDDHADLISLLPKRLQPIFLSQAVTEHLDSKCRESVVYHSIADKLKYQMSSKLFSAGIIRLIKHERLVKRHKVPVRQTVLDSIEQSLKKIRIQGVDKVITYLSINSRALRGTEAEQESFAEKTAEDKEDVAGSEIWNVYVNKLACFSEELQTSVSEAVNKMTGGLLSNCIHYIQPILSCLPHNIPKVLDKLAIKPDTPSHMQTSTDMSNQPTLPTPGSLVPKEDHHLLKEDFEEFEHGEYIGYELEDEEDMEDGQRTIIYAIVLEKMVDEDFDNTFGSTTPSPGPPSDKKRGRSGSHYSPQRTRSRTGHSMSSDPEGHKFTQKYRINVGEKRPPAIAPVTDLYKFHRVKGRRRWNGGGGFGGGGDESYKSATTPTSPYTPNSHHPDDEFNDYVYQPEESENRQHYSKDSSFRMPSSSGTGHQPRQPHHRMDFNRQPRQPFSDNNLFVDEDNDNNDTSQSYNDDNNNYYDNEGDFTDHQQQQRHFQQQQHDYYQPHHQQQHEQQQQDVMKYDEEWGSKNQSRQAPRMGEEKEGPQYNDPNNDPNNQDDVITTEKVMGEVSDALEEAWVLPEPQRKKVVKRLLLRWHPDKNIGNEEFATVITQHVQAELERLELGLPRPSNFDPSQFDFDPRNPFSNSTSFKTNFANAYKYFFDQMNQRAKEHKQQRERYKENRDTNSSDGFFFQGTNPQPGQAKRFLRQAQEDLRAADNDFDALDPAYEWTCFKAHQASEKALKAAQFAVDAVTSFSHDLVTLAASLEDTELRRLAQKLQKIVGNSNRLYNPDPMDFTVIPHEEFTKDMACDAVMCAVDILERVKEFVELRDQ